jgi:hypothetical protein
MLAEKSVYAIAKTEGPELRIDSFLDSSDLHLVFDRLACELLVTCLDRRDFLFQLLNTLALRCISSSCLPSASLIYLRSVSSSRILAIFDRAG